MDFNNDGILDLLVGERKGHFNFYTGNGDGTLHFIGYPFDSASTEIQRNFNSSGYLVDWNQNGCLDFVTGGYNDEIPNGGILQVHLNTSDDLTSAIWNASVIDLTSSVSDQFRQTFQVYDLDNDGDKDFILGCETGTVLFSENIGNADLPLFNGCETLQCDGGDIDVMFNYDAGGRARENVTDYNSDGIPDLLVGFCDDGGIYMFEGYTTGIEQESSHSITDFQMELSENPVNGIFSVILNVNSTNPVKIKIIDNAGRLVEQSIVCCEIGINTFQMNIADQPSGLYFVVVSNDDFTKRSNLVLLN